MVCMNLQGIVSKVEQKFHEAQERVAVTLLIWFQKEPSQDRVLSTSVTDTSGDPYLRYGSRAGRRAAEKERASLRHASWGKH